MTNKLKLLIFLLLALVGISLLNRKPPVPFTPKNGITQNQSTLVIDYGDGNKITASFIPKPSQTVFDALKAIVEEKNISLDTQQYDFGVFVKAIGGYESSAEMAWIYFVNATAGTIAADQQEVKAGDQVEWRYVKPE